MMTPGQAAYTTLRNANALVWAFTSLWFELPEADKEQWEVIAQAAIAQHGEQFPFCACHQEECAPECRPSH